MCIESSFDVQTCKVKSKQHIGKKIQIQKKITFKLTCITKRHPFNTFIPLRTCLQRKETKILKSFLITTYRTF